MNTIVLDASVVIKWLRKDEDQADVALLLYQEHIAKTKRIIVPSLLFIEVANFLATWSGSTKETIQEGMELLFESQLHIESIKEKHLFEAALLAKQYKASVYDMLYAVIAKRNDTILITADKRFVTCVDFTFVRLLTEYL